MLVIALLVLGVGSLAVLAPGAVDRAPARRKLRGVDAQELLRTARAYALEPEREGVYRDPAVPPRWLAFRPDGRGRA